MVMEDTTCLVVEVPLDYYESRAWGTRTREDVAAYLREVADRIEAERPEEDFRGDDQGACVGHQDVLLARWYVRPPRNMP